MIPCPGCKQIVFLDVDGNVIPPDAAGEAVALEEPQAELEPAEADDREESPSQEEQAEESPDEFYAQATEEIEETEMEGSAEPEETVMREDVDFSGGTEDAPADDEPVQESSAEEEVAAEEVAAEEGDAEDFEGTEDMGDLPAAAGAYAPEDLSELADYGNSELSVAKDGQFLYDLKVSGIDSQDIKKLIEENLTDKRLGLNVKGLMKSIKNGVLEIRRINAVKTSILVNRFKSLPVTLQWRQNVITQMDINN